MKQATLTLAAVLVAAAALSAQTQGQQATPPPASEKPAADKAPTAPVTIAGNWNISLDAGQGPMDIYATMKLDGKKLTGTLSSQMGDVGLVGESADMKVTFSIDFNGTAITFTGALKDADHVEGTMSGPMGDIPWKGVRAKAS